MLDEIKNKLRYFNALQKLIAINVIVYLLVNIGNVLFRLFNFPEDFISGMVADWVAVPSALPTLITRPWTIITYAFYHERFLHILFNMLWLYFMGQLFVEYLGEKKLTALYFLGGISGALLFILFYNIFPLFNAEVNFSVALGASASVLAITVAIATLLPDYTVSLFVPGFTVKLKYIAIVLFLIDLLSIAGSNAGGSIAHIGGAIFGFVFIKQLQKGKDISAGTQHLIARISSVFSKQPVIRVVHRKSASDATYHETKQASQETIDRILDKISKSGYQSLSNDEKDILFKASKNQK